MSSFFYYFASSSLASPSLFSFTWPQPFLGCASSTLPPLPGPTPPEGRESNRLRYLVSSPGCQSASIRLALPPTACSPLVHNHPHSLYLHPVFLSSLSPFPFLKSFACLTSQTFSSIYTTRLLIACYALHHKRRLDATTYFLAVNTLLAHISAFSAVKCKTHQFELFKPLRVAIAAFALVVSAQKTTTPRLHSNPPRPLAYAVLLPSSSSHSPHETIMCYQLVEVYSACRCLYYQHAVDRCVGYGRPGHGVEKRVIYVGYACGAHTTRRAHHASHHSYSDSGYQSYRSTTKSYR